MTIGQLKEIIKDMPDNLDVMIYQTNDESLYNMAEKAKIEDVLFGSPEIPRKEWGVEKCLVITDEI